MLVNRSHYDGVGLFLVKNESYHTKKLLAIVIGENEFFYWARK